MATGKSQHEAKAKAAAKLLRKLLESRELPSQEEETHNNSEPELLSNETFQQPAMMADQVVIEDVSGNLKYDALDTYPHSVELPEGDSSYSDDPGALLEERTDTRSPRFPCPTPASFESMRPLPPVPVTQPIPRQSWFERLCCFKL